MVNRELAAKVADAIESRSVNGLAFDMRTLGETKKAFHENRGVKLRHPVKDRLCNTVACIAGFVVVEALGHRKGMKILRENTKYNLQNIDAMARDLLGLDDAQAGYLFYPEDMEAVTDKEAVKALRHLVKTGEVVAPGSI